MHTELSDISAALGRIEANQKNAEERLKALDRRLFGNGQPGVIEKLEKRVDELEGWHNRLLGATGILGTIAGFLGAWLRGWLAHSKG